MVAHLTGGQGVAGSNPAVPTGQRLVGAKVQPLESQTESSRSPTGPREGAQFTVLWGEPDGGTNKPVVERDIQTEIPVTLTTSSPAKATG